MGEKNFKQVGKLQFSVEVPMDSDLMIAVKIATERRDKGLEEFVEFIKLGATQKDKEKISAGLDEILQINENIKVMEDAAVAVRMYKLEEQKNQKQMDKRLKDVDLIDELQMTFEDVHDQLIEDEKRYGDTWKERGLVWEGQPQEDRFFSKMQIYFNDYFENGTSLPWLKIIGEAHIALVREKKLK